MHRYHLKIHLLDLEGPEAVHAKTYGVGVLGWPFPWLTCQKSQVHHSE